MTVGDIVVSLNLWSSLIVMVPKRASTIEWLNMVAQFDGYCMPHEDEPVEHLGEVYLMPTLDIIKG